MVFDVLGVAPSKTISRSKWCRYSFSGLHPAQLEYPITLYYVETLFCVTLYVTFVPWTTAFRAASWAFIHFIGATLSEKLLGKISADIPYNFPDAFTLGLHHSIVIWWIVHSIQPLAQIQAFFYKAVQTVLLLPLRLVWYSLYNLPDAFALGLHSWHRKVDWLYILVRQSSSWTKSIACFSASSWI